MVGTLSQSDYTRVVCKDACARVARAGVVGTLSQSDFIGLRVQGLCAGVVHCDWLLSLANQIFQI